MRQLQMMVLEDQVVERILDNAKITDKPSTFKELMNFGADDASELSHTG